MEKEILYEINRFREISGLPLLKESIGGGLIDEFLSLFGKSVDDIDTLVKTEADDIGMALKNSIDEIAQLPGGKTFDDIIADIKAGRLSNDLADNIAKKLVKSDNREISQKMAEAVVNTNPSLKKMADELSSDDLFKASKKSNDLQSARKTYEDSLEAIGKRGESNEIKNELDRRLFNNYYSAKSEIEANIKNLTNALKGMLDETGDLTEGIKKEIQVISKVIKVKPDVLESRAKQFISDNKNITLEQLQKKLADSQTQIQEAANKLKGVRRAGFKAKYDAFKEYLPKMPPLTKPVKIALIIASLGVIGASYVAFEYYQVDIEEAQDILKRLIDYCDGKITPNHVKALGSDEEIDKYYPKVVYDGQLQTVIEKEGEFYLTKKDGIGQDIKITCIDPKLANKTVEEIGVGKPAEEGSLTTMTKAQAIEAIKNNGYTEPITLTPDSDGQTTYNYTDAGGLTGTVTLKDGNIIVD
jgi:hypothetical protein